MLSKIIQNKKKEVKLAKRLMPLGSFKSKIQKSSKDFKKAISKNKLNLVAEIKRRSPSHNNTNSELDLNNATNI